MSGKPFASRSPRLILASGSPRRLEILRSLGLDPEVLPAEVLESPLPGEDPSALVGRLARDKVLAVAARLRGEAREASSEVLILGADTVVALDGEILGKPRDPAEASRMLAALSGRTHEVLSGVAIGSADGRLELGVERTRVRFAVLTPKLIEEYVASGDPMDKAGAYGIQSGARTFASSLEGSYSNVVGLPVELFEVLLGRFGWTIGDLRAGTAP